MINVMVHLASSSGKNLNLSSSLMYIKYLQQNELLLHFTSKVIKTQSRKHLLLLKHFGVAHCVNITHILKKPVTCSLQSDYSKLQGKDYKVLPSNRLRQGSSKIPLAAHPYFRFPQMSMSAC